MRNRRGFTLIELMFVIAIISLMVALLVGASFRFVASAKETATSTTVTKAGGIISDRVQAFRDHDFHKEVDFMVSRWATAGKTPVLNNAVAEIFIRKRQFKAMFPQCFAELDDAAKTKYFGTTVIPPTNTEYDRKFEPGIMLYALLTKGQSYGQQTVGTDTFGGAEVRNDSATGNLPCIVDAWGEPLRFYRWPTRLIRCGEQSWKDYNNNGSTADNAGTIDFTTGNPQISPAIRPNGTLKNPTPASLLIKSLPQFDITSSYSLGADGTAGVLGGNSTELSRGWYGSDDPEPMNSDPDDPTMELWTFLAQAGTSKQFVVGQTLDSTGTTYVDAYHDPFTWSAPLIVSAGPDRLLGLYEPQDIPTVTYPNSVNYGYLAAPEPLPTSVNRLFDNLTNLNRMVGGK